MSDATTTTRDEEESDAEANEGDVDTSHLDDVADGCGCAEVWEHTSTARESADAE